MVEMNKFEWVIFWVCALSCSVGMLCGGIGMIKSRGGMRWDIDDLQNVVKQHGVVIDDLKILEVTNGEAIIFLTKQIKEITVAKSDVKPKAVLEFTIYGQPKRRER